MTIEILSLSSTVGVTLQRDGDHMWCNSDVTVLTVVGKQKIVCREAQAHDYGSLDDI